MRKKKAVIHSIGGRFYFSLHASNGKLLCESKPVKRKMPMLKSIENNFPDFIIIDNS